MEVIWVFGLFLFLVIKERVVVIVYNWFFLFIFILWRNSCVNFIENDWELMKIVRWLLIFDCYVLINILLKDRREKELLRLKNCGDGF